MNVSEIKMIHNYESKQTFADIFKKREKPLVLKRTYTFHGRSGKVKQEKPLF